MKKTLALLGVSSLVVSALLATSVPAQALGKIKCDDSGSATVAVGSFDPIVNHNQAGSSHEHQFFGNRAWLSLPQPNAANYTDLSGKATNCRKVLGLAYSADTAGYWTPTLRFKTTGQLIPARQFTAYYRAFDGKSTGQGLAFPADTRLVATDDAGAGAHGWNCGQFSAQARRDGTVGYIPDCTGESGGPGHTLTAHINFPTCWNGVLPNHQPGDVGNTSDNANYAYAVKSTCPAGFPNKVVQLRETIQFSYVGAGNDVELSSDPGAGVTDGISMHGDFWNAWMQPDFERFVRECVNSNVGTAKQCQP